MKVTDNTKRALKTRRHIREMEVNGYEKVDMRRYMPWEATIEDVKIGLHKDYVWIKVKEREWTSPTQS